MYRAHASVTLTIISWQNSVSLQFFPLPARYVMTEARKLNATNILFFYHKDQWIRNVLHQNTILLARHWNCPELSIGRTFLVSVLHLSLVQLDNTQRKQPSLQQQDTDKQLIQALWLVWLVNKSKLSMVYRGSEKNSRPGSSSTWTSTQPKLQMVTAV